MNFDNENIVLSRKGFGYNDQFFNATSPGDSPDSGGDSPSDPGDSYAQQQYEEDLATYNRQYESLGCGTLTPPLKPIYQDKITNPVNNCDIVANQKADEINAQLQANYNEALSIYNTNLEQCNALVEPTPPDNSLNFSNATGDNHNRNESTPALFKLIISAGFLYLILKTLKF